MLVEALLDGLQVNLSGANLQVDANSLVKITELKSFYSNFVRYFLFLWKRSLQYWSRNEPSFDAGDVAEGEDDGEVALERHGDRRQDRADPVVDRDKRGK